MSESRAYQTYLPRCDCSGGILEKDGAIYCRWCRKPYAEGGMINYRDECFQEKGVTVFKQVDFIEAERNATFLPKATKRVNLKVRRVVNYEDL
jgi:hypothetical protein